MSDAMTSFLEIVKYAAPFSLSWNLGIIAYNFIVGAMTGKDVSI